jgi:hypothetical protein
MISCLADGHGHVGSLISHYITQNLPSILSNHLYALHSKLPSTLSDGLDGLPNVHRSLVHIAINMAIEEVQRGVLQITHAQSQAQTKALREFQQVEDENDRIKKENDELKGLVGKLLNGIGMLKNDCEILGGVFGPQIEEKRTKGKKMMGGDGDGDDGDGDDGDDDNFGDFDSQIEDINSLHSMDDINKYIDIPPHIMMLINKHKESYFEENNSTSGKILMEKMKLPKVFIPHSNKVHFNPNITKSLHEQFPPIPISLIPCLLPQSSRLTPAKMKTEDEKKAKFVRDCFWGEKNVKSVKNVKNEIICNYLQMDKSLSPRLESGSTVLIIVVDTQDIIFKCPLHPYGAIINRFDVEKNEKITEIGQG